MSGVIPLSVKGMFSVGHIILRISRRKRMVTTITGIGFVFHIIFFYPIKCVSIKEMIDYKHFILRLIN